MTLKIWMSIWLGFIFNMSYHLTIESWKGLDMEPLAAAS